MKMPIASSDLLGIVLVLALSGARGSAPSHAQTAQPPPAQAPAAAQTCAACHGANGEGNAATHTPRIAGQSARYLAKQLESYTDGTRRNAVMEPIAKGLPVEARIALAEYYSQLDASPRKPAGGSMNERGRQVATQGDPERRVQGCINCHGPDGIGEPPAIPYVAGLDANYIVSAMNAWREGTRRNDAGQQMATVAKALTPEAISDVAQYYAALAPPGPAALDLVQAPPAAGTRSSAATPATKQSEGKATPGIEQGATVSSGTHGEGQTGAAKGAPSSSGTRAPPK